MPPSNFNNRLNSIDLTQSSNTEFSKSYQALRNIADSIQDKLNSGLTDAPIHIEIEPGFHSSKGRQLKLVLRIPDKSFRTGFFRAYIPDDGFPIYLDLYGEEPEKCDTIEELEDHVIEFLNQTKDNMLSYREYARK